VHMWLGLRFKVDRSMSAISSGRVAPQRNEESEWMPYL
jgi:hypothetical protein